MGNTDLDDLGDALGQRRQVTILSADLVGYTPLAERLGEEATFEAIRPIIKDVIDAVEANCGRVEHIAGDGVLAVFGAPEALEDAPMWACSAALDVQAKLAARSDGFLVAHGVRPQLRVGVNTGPVVLGRIGSGGRSEVRTVGDTVNLAARLQAAAPPGHIVISEATRALVAARIETEALGPITLKGKAAVQTAHRLLALRADIGRFDAPAKNRDRFFVGRDAELRTIEQVFAETRPSSPQVVHIIGPPGIGKSRLAHEFCARRETDATVLRAYCTPIGTGKAFGPFVQIVRSAGQLESGSSGPQLREGLRAMLAAVGLDPAHEPILAHLLGVSGVAELKDLDAELLGLRTRTALQQLIEHLSRDRRLIVLIDDLQWADRVSQQMLGNLVSGNGSLFFVCTVRPGFAFPWDEASNLLNLTLQPLSDAKAGDLLRRHLASEAVDERQLAAMLGKSEGNPLYIEELAHHLALRTQPGAAPSPLATSLSPTLEAILLARVDRLSKAARAALTVVSIVGQSFDAPLLAAIPHLPDPVTPVLAELEDHDLLVADSSTSPTTYRVKHILVAEAIYGSVLSKERAGLHAIIAAALAARSGDQASIADTLVYHFERAGNAAKTIEFLHLGAAVSFSVYALDEAYTKVTRALELAHRNPADVIPSRLADILLLAYRILVDKNRISEIIDHLSRSMPRLDGAVDASRLSQCLTALGHTYALRSDPQLARSHLDRALALALDHNDDLAAARARFGLTWYHLIWTPPGVEGRDRVVGLSDAAIAYARTQSDAWLEGSALHAQAIFPAAEGRMAACRAITDRMMALSRERNHPLPRQWALNALGFTAIMINEPQKALDITDEALQLGLAPINRVQIAAFRGSALLLMGRIEEARQLLEEISATLEADGLHAMLPLTLPSLGAAHVMVGNMRHGVRIIEGAIRRFGALGYNPLIHGLGHLMLGEVFLGLAESRDRPPFKVLIANIGFLLRHLPTARRRARRHLEASIEASRQWGLLGTLSSALMALARLERLQGRPDAARARFDEARQVAVSIEANALVSQCDKLAGAI